MTVYISNTEILKSAIYKDNELIYNKLIINKLFHSNGITINNAHFKNIKLFILLNNDYLIVYLHSNETRNYTSI